MTHTKANKSKVLALILGLTMCLALMLGIVFASPTSTAYAEGETLTPYDSIIVNGSNTGLNSGRYLDEEYTEQVGNPDTGYVAKYNNGVLTLNNYKGKQVGRSAIGSGYYIIELIGNNVITGSRSCVLMDSSSGGRVIIRGNGTLTLNANNVAGESCFAIDGGSSAGYDQGEVVIEGNAKVTINAATNGKDEYAVGIIARNLTIQDNASVDITVKNTNNDTVRGRAQGVLVKNMLTINTNGKIEIDATVAGGDSAYSYGINASNATYTKIKDMTIKWNGSDGVPVAGSTRVDSTTHAINENSKNCFASYRYGTPRYVVAANGKLAGPGVPESLNTDWGYFLAGDLVTLNAQNLQVSETDTTNIPFDKWFSFANDTVITNATSQTGAILTVPNKDTIVYANYKAFTEQPVFERESDTTGKVTCTIISNNNEDWLKFYSINDLENNILSNFMLLEGTTHEADIYESSMPNGQYVVTVQYNGTTIYSEPFTVDYTERKATIDSVTISGEQDEPIASTDITVTLTGYTFETALSGKWITNLPAGLVQSVTKESDTVAKITVSGTPTALSDQVVEITIPKANITGLASDLTVESNSDAKFNIVAPLKKVLYPKVKDIEYNGKPQSGVEEGEGYTLADHIATNAGEYKATATLESGYKWSDGYTERSRIVKWTIKKRTAKAEDFIFTPPSNLVYDNSGKRPSVKIKDEFNYTGYLNFDYKCGESVVLEPVDAGEYKVYVNVSSTKNFNAVGKIHDASWKYTIANASQNMPDASRITTVAPTSSSANDGIIHGIGNDMEYRKAGDALWTQGTGSSITGLSSGNYEIRYKAKFNYDASPSITVTVLESGVASYSLTVNNGTGGGVFTEGASVTITANAPTTGQRFTGWTIEGVSGLDTTQTSLTFNMPANAVTATANYEDIEYTITVNDGTADKTKAKYGETVTITATVPTGKKFVEWTSESGIAFADKMNATTTFTMPAEDVTVTATFEDETYRITVTNGTATPETATYQTEVTVKANEPDTDMYFDKWEVTGLDTTDMDLTKTEIKFQMPAGNVTFKATYRNAENFVVTVTGGTGGGTYKEGDEVTVTAEDKEGKVFKGWKDESGEIVSTEKSYKFTVSGETTLTAVYDDMSSGGGEITPPAKKDGLSGGAIAGIVIGSVAVAGLGGFAIFWFAVKKKTFADLITAIKALFTKKK